MQIMSLILNYIWASMKKSTMNKKILYLFYLAALILLIFVFIQIRGYYLFIKSPVAQLPEAFPGNTQMVIGATNAADFIATTRASGLSEVLSPPGIRSGFEQLISTADSLAAEDELFRNLLESKPFMTGFVPDSTGIQQWLLAFSIGKQGPDKFNLHSKVFAQNHSYDFSKINHSIADIYSFCRSDKCVHYYIYKGLLCLSPDEATLRSSLEAMKSKSNLFHDELFITLARTSGKKVDASLIIRSAELIGLFLDKEKTATPANLFTKGWTTLDLTIRKDKLMLNGFTGTPAPVALFAHEMPLPLQMMGIPENITAIYGFLLANPSKVLETIIGSDTIHALGYDLINNTNTKEIFRIGEDLDPWLGKFSFKLSNENHQEIVVIENRQTDSTFSAFNRFTEPVEPGITKITDINLFKRLFGSLYHTHVPVYCLNHPALLAFSSSLPGLRNYAHTLNAPGVRGQATSMATVLNNTQEKANFIAIRTPADNNDKPDDRMSWLKRCQMLSIKISAGEPFMYSSGAIYFEAPKKSLAYMNEQSRTDSIPDLPVITIPAANVGRETAISFTPLVVGSEKAGENRVAFLGRNSLSINDYKGQQIFEWQSPEPLTGQLFATGYTQRDQPRYIVTGENHLFHLSAEGILLKKIKLPAGIASASGFFDYERRKDYRIIYQDAERKIHSITVDGKALPDWQKPQSTSLSMAPEFIRNAGKDYLFFSSRDGNLMITDRRGRERIKIYEGFKKSANAGIYENRTNAKGIFLTATDDGRLAYITDRGVISYSAFGHFGEHPYFEYADFDGDGSMDFMFAGKEKLGVYTRMKKSIAEFTIKGGMLGKPFVYASSLGKGWIAVRDTCTGLVYLINNKGEQLPLGKLRSDTDPIIFNPGGSRQIVMVTSLNNKPVFTLLK